MADPQHDVARIVPALSDPPQLQLLGEVGGRLPVQRRIGGTEPLPFLAMASGAGKKPALRIALMVKRQRVGRPCAAAVERQTRVIEGHRPAFAGVKLPRDPRHLRVLAAPVRISFELPLHVTAAEACQPRRPGTVAASVKSMAAEAGVGRPGLGAAERNYATILGKTIERRRFRRGASGEQSGGERDDHRAHRFATSRRRVVFPLAVLMLAACKPPPDQRQFMPQADAARGRAVIERVGCGSCHLIPGVHWPQGKVGPALQGLAERGLIAGKLPNEPDVLAAFIRNAPALVPGSAMPAMPVNESEARDIAAYLYDQGAE